MIHQFALTARPATLLPMRKKMRGGKGKRGLRVPWRAVEPPVKRKPGLAAAKHAQRQKAVKARPALSPLAMEFEWPEAMKLELFNCRTPTQRRFWQERWAEVLSGRAAQRAQVAALPARPIAKNRSHQRYAALGG